MNPIDPRAGVLCTNCNAPKPAEPKPHCTSPTCSWWRCTRCATDNDAAGNNSRIDAAGRKKVGAK